MHRNLDDRRPAVAGAGNGPLGPSAGAAVVALHCSGGDGRQWRGLSPALGPSFRVFAPSLIGCGDAGPWCGSTDFTLMDEARPVIELVDLLDRPVHLVGHSYGGALALKVAVERPDRVVSLSLFEPSAFHILRQMGPAASDELAEVATLAERIGSGILRGAYRQAAAGFVDYWNGSGRWASLPTDVQQSLVRWLPKTPLDFQALIEDDTPAERHAAVHCPILLQRGEHSPAPSRRIVDELMRRLANARLSVIAGAGHMGPLTHWAAVGPQIAAHIHASTGARSPDKRFLAHAA